MTLPGDISSKIKPVNKPPYIIDAKRLQRYPQKHIIFARVIWDQNFLAFQRRIDERVFSIMKENKPGYQRVDFALRKAAWTVHDTFAGSFARTRIKKYRIPQAELDQEFPAKYEVSNPRIMSTQIKRAAALFGASLTGICKLNRLWLYADAQVPEHLTNAIVLAIEMDLEGIATSPAMPAAGATGVGYSKMGFILALLGEFIRNLGYEAYQCGNDTGLSIPLAIDAGLGQLGRNGLLITPQFGSRVRLCKIFTDLPLAPDRPIDFGVTETCKQCRQCAELCEVDAISKDENPSFDGVCFSSNPGALKWYVDSERCYEFWCDNGGDCSTCITVCPYNRVSTEKYQVSPNQFWIE